MSFFRIIRSSALLLAGALAVEANSQTSESTEADIWKGFKTSTTKGKAPVPVDDIAELSHGLIAAFLGPDLVLYDLFDRAVSEPVPLKDSIPGWPATWTNGVTAALEWDSASVMLFKESSMAWLNLEDLSMEGAPEPFEGLPAEWKNGVEAAVRWDAYQAYLFHGSEYVIWDLAQDAFSDRMSLMDWEGWPGTWTRFDGAINLGDGKVHFIRGEEVLVFDQLESKFLEGYPRRYASIDK